MDWGWLANRHREIAHLPLARQHELLEAATRRFRRDPRTWLLYAPLCFLPAALPVAFHALPLRLRFQWPSHVAFVAILLLGVAAQAWVWRTTVRRSLRAELSARHIRPAHCFDCGYDLRATTADRCPECGAGLPGAPDDRPPAPASPPTPGPQRTEGPGAFGD